MQTHLRNAAVAAHLQSAEGEPDPDALINSKLACELAGGISQMTLYRWLRRSLIPPPLYIERRRFWKRKEFLEALLTAGRQGQQSAQMLTQEEATGNGGGV